MCVSSWEGPLRARTSWSCWGRWQPPLSRDWHRGEGPSWKGRMPRGTSDPRSTAALPIRPNVKLLPPYGRTSGGLRRRPGEPVATARLSQSMGVDAAPAPDAELVCGFAGGGRDSRRGIDDGYSASPAWAHQRPSRMAENSLPGSAWFRGKPAQAGVCGSLVSAKARRRGPANSLDARSQGDRQI